LVVSLAPSAGLVSVAAGVVVSVLVASGAAASLLHAVKPADKDRLAITSKVFQFIKISSHLDFLKPACGYKYYHSTDSGKIQGHRTQETVLF
jgi:hypothetical protein